MKAGNFNARMRKDYTMYIAPKVNVRIECPEPRIVLVMYIRVRDRAGHTYWMAFLPCCCLTPYYCHHAWAFAASC